MQPTSYIQVQTRTSVHETRAPRGVEPATLVSALDLQAMMVSQGRVLVVRGDVGIVSE